MAGLSWRYAIADRLGFDNGLSESGSPILDLGGLRVITAYGLVGFACVLNHNQAEGLRTIVQLPHPSQDTAEYLSRMDFQKALDLCDCEVKGELPQVKRQYRSDRLLELRPFSGSGDVKELTELIWNGLERQVSPQVVDAIWIGIGEVADNVRYHAKCDYGWVAAETYAVGTREERVEVAIGDSGIGILEALSQAEDVDRRPRNDRDAIELALMVGVSSLEPGRGQGLPSTKDAICGLRGTVSIRTGRSNVHVSSLMQPQVATSMRGTLVGLTVPCRP